MRTKQEIVLKPRNIPRLKYIKLIKEDLDKKLLVHSLRIGFENDRFYCADFGEDLEPIDIANMLEQLAKSIRKDIASGDFGHDYANYYNAG